MPESNRQVISVSELTRDARDLLESAFPAIFVEGEISNLAQPSSGHWYFTLKDDRSQVRCAMFRNRNHMIRFKPRNGQQIIVRGRISLYEARGEFQMIAEFMEEAGDGALRRAYEKLKADLQAEGLFAESRKKPVPSMPSHVAILTSPTGAAIHDVLTVMGRRFPGIKVSLVPIQVQGEDSVRQIVKAMAFANSYTADPFDLILLTRGGGSLEDLWSFNTEPVARAVAESRLPVVCAVGHESDVSIADFVADLRAPTPSAAAELITPDGEVWKNEFADLERQLLSNMINMLEYHGREVVHLRRRLRHPEHRLQDLQQRADELNRRLIREGQRQLEGYTFDETRRRLTSALNNKIAHHKASLAALKLRSPTQALATRQEKVRQVQEQLTRAVVDNRNTKANRLALVAEKLGALSPLSTLERGYAIVTNETGHVITDAEELNTGDKITARLQTGEVTATVTDKSV